MKILQKTVLVFTLFNVFSFSAYAEKKAYIPFKGKIKVIVEKIENAKTIHVKAETWPGFVRQFRVTLPNISLPQNNANAAECEQKLAQQALAFTTAFLTTEKRVSIHNMVMENSADEDGLSNLYTKEGGLIEALKGKGFARSNTVPVETSWC